jgi:hypothetical protein
MTAMSVMMENTKDWKSSVLVRILRKNISAPAEMKTLENPTTRVGRPGDRIPVGARIPAHVQTGPGAHPAYCTMVTGSPSLE